jgi:hypothetical protein
MDTATLPEEPVGIIFDNPDVVLESNPERKSTKK